MDAVDKILAQWQKSRPDLDVSAMGTIGRMSRVFHHMTNRMAATFERHGLNASGFDVLATLRRAPSPHTLSPGELMSSMMITSGTMTNRIDQLVKAGLVTRESNRKDARRAEVKLTNRGLHLIDGALADHVSTQKSLLCDLSEEEIAQLNTVLSKLLAAADK